jgi:hypothetical protein
MQYSDDQAPRIREQLLRERLLTGAHRPDITAEIQKDYAPEIAAELQLNPDLSENAFHLTLSQIAVSYDEPPEVSADGDPDLDAIVTPALWPKMQERDMHQRGIRECFVRLDWPTEEGIPAEVQYRVVTPGRITKAVAARGQPDRVAMVEEWRPRTRGTDEGPIHVETYETWDVRDPAAPVFRIEEIDEDGRRIDMTAVYAGGTEYPYRDPDGAPILPYVLYHARLQDRLFDWMAGTELVAGTLRLAVGWTSWWDAFNNSASPQRVAIDLEPPAGTAITIQGARNLETITTSPKTILKFNSTRDGSGRIDTYPPGLSPMEGVEALRSYGERLAVYAGLNPGDLQASGSSRSGIAIIVSRDGQRRAQQRAEPSNRAGDRQLLACAARLANAYGGTALPTDERAYQIQYARLGLSQQERALAIENLTAERDLGLVSRVTLARRLDPSLESDEEAIAYLVQQQVQENALAAALAPLMPAPAPAPTPDPATEPTPDNGAPNE